MAGFRKTILCLLSFGVVIVLIQMIALGRLNVQSSARLPWDAEGERTVDREKVRPHVATNY